MLSALSHTSKTEYKCKSHYCKRVLGWIHQKTKGRVRTHKCFKLRTSLAKKNQSSEEKCVCGLGRVLLWLVFKDENIWVCFSIGPFPMSTLRFRMYFNRKTKVVPLHALSLDSLKINACVCMFASRQS